MIVSHRYRFIFIKPRKAASTSVEIALSRLCGPTDIVTPLSRTDEQLRSEEGGQGPVNYRPNGWYLKPSYLVQTARRRKAPRAFKGHTSAIQARARLPSTVWQTYTKICVTRNPWDLAISHYYWRLWELQKKGSNNVELTIDEYITHLYQHYSKWLTNWYQMADGKELLMDRVLRYESLDEDLQALSRALGLEESIALPRTRAKGQQRRDRRNHREILSERQRRMIEEVAKLEIEAFGHSW